MKRLLLLAVLGLAAWFAYSEIQGSRDGTTSSERVVIPKGASMRAAAESLAVHDVIGSTRLFRWYTAAAGRERTIKPGTYQFPSGAGYASVLDALVTGRGIMRTVVIPEGFDLRDIAPVLAKALSVSEDSVRAAVTDTTSPGFSQTGGSSRAPAPVGVPQTSTSPGSSVMKRLM